MSGKTVFFPFFCPVRKRARLGTATLKLGGTSHVQSTSVSPYVIDMCTYVTPRTPTFVPIEETSKELSFGHYLSPNLERN